MNDHRAYGKNVDKLQTNLAVDKKGFYSQAANTKKTG